MRPLSGVFGGRWTSDEDAAIREGFEAGKSWMEISEGLPGRTKSATRAHGEQLGLKQREAWTLDEDAALRAGLEAGRSWKEIAEGLAGRTVRATQSRGTRLGLKHCEAGARWTADEEMRLRVGLEGGESWQAIAAGLPGRTAYGSEHRARQLGLERETPPMVVEAWTEAEDEVIRAGVAAGEATNEIAKRLPGRTPSALASRRVVLGERPVTEGELRVLQRWTDAEDAALRECFESGRSWREIAEKLPGRTMFAVKTRGIKQLGLKHGDSAGST
jgi:hypothetical protein